MINQGDVFIVNFSDVFSTKYGHLQQGIRPCVVVGNNKNNKFCSLVQVIPITTKKDKLPQHTVIYMPDSGRKCYLLPEMLTVIDKSLLRKYCGNLYSSNCYGAVIKCMDIQYHVEEMYGK